LLALLSDASAMPAQDERGVTSIHAAVFRGRAVAVARRDDGFTWCKSLLWDETTRIMC